MNFIKTKQIIWCSASKEFDEYRPIDYFLLGKINKNLQEQIYVVIAPIDQSIIFETNEIIRDSLQPSELF